MTRANPQSPNMDTLKNHAKYSNEENSRGHVQIHQRCASVSCRRILESTVEAGTFEETQIEDEEEQLLDRLGLGRGKRASF